MSLQYEPSSEPLHISARPNPPEITHTDRVLLAGTSLALTRRLTPWRPQQRSSQVFDYTPVLFAHSNYSTSHKLGFYVARVNDSIGTLVYLLRCIATRSACLAAPLMHTRVLSRFYALWLVEGNYEGGCRAVACMSGWVNDRVAFTERLTQNVRSIAGRARLGREQKSFMWTWDVGLFRARSILTQTHQNPNPKRTAQGDGGGGVWPDGQRPRCGGDKGGVRPGSHPRGSSTEKSLHETNVSIDFFEGHSIIIIA